MRIAKESHTRVLAMNDESKSTGSAGVIPVEMKSAAVGYFDENGNWQSEADRPVVMSNAPMTTARAETAPPMAPTPSRPATTGSQPGAQTPPADVEQPRAVRAHQRPVACRRLRGPRQIRQRLS